MKYLKIFSIILIAMVVFVLATQLIIMKLHPEEKLGVSFGILMKYGYVFFLIATIVCTTIWFLKNKNVAKIISISALILLTAYWLIPISNYTLKISGIIIVQLLILSLSMFYSRKILA